MQKSLTNEDNNWILVKDKNFIEIEKAYMEQISLKRSNYSIRKRNRKYAKDDKNNYQQKEDVFYEYGYGVVGFFNFIWSLLCFLFII